MGQQHEPLALCYFTETRSPGGRSWNDRQEFPLDYAGVWQYGMVRCSADERRACTGPAVGEHLHGLQSVCGYLHGQCLTASGNESGCLLGLCLYKKNPAVGKTGSIGKKILENGHETRRI